MEALSLEDKYDLIERGLENESSLDPVEIAIHLMKIDGISMHGPEHHFLDGAAFLKSYANAGGSLDLKTALSILRKRALTMPGAMCGYWGMCGSVSSVGAALSIIHGVSPISDSSYYKDDMEFSSKVLKRMSEIGGPRCCKRNAFLSLSTGADFVKEKYGVNMESPKVIGCEFVKENPQCLYMKCPFFGKKTIFR